VGLRRISRLLERGEDADLLEVWYVHLDWIASRLAAEGAAVQVQDPPEVRAAVIHRLREHAGELEPQQPAESQPAESQPADAQPAGSQPAGSRP
jgi:proteasome accessory factor B